MTLSSPGDRRAEPELLAVFPCSGASGHSSPAAYVVSGAARHGEEQCALAF